MLDQLTYSRKVLMVRGCKFQSSLPVTAQVAIYSGNQWRSVAVLSLLVHIKMIPILVLMLDQLTYSRKVLMVRGCKFQSSLPVTAQVAINSGIPWQSVVVLSLLVQIRIIPILVLMPDQLTYSRKVLMARGCKFQSLLPVTAQVT